ncbi:tellurite resistance protein TehB [Anatilimnocola aggregata]|uniref:Tellurite resistance protein TehB n=1 Tax=Anatilimnocola aggregata TaxID=2528021 RepID=A0A517YER0_9BACT|nr:class I SAM-dependent methyltransferase [Anatilimnocola aggregata]QDU28698.1 tellurite resistance protein TehB [Anatilimnocola aggregata]
MSAEDREKWNAKYSDPAFAPRNPSPTLLSLVDWLPPTRGRALDVAGGAGRHSIWLAKLGFEVTLADVSAVGLQVAQRRASDSGVKITTIEHDLERHGLPVGPWDLIVSICYLWRPTPRLMVDALSPHGVFVMIQPTTINLTKHEKPPRDFLLQPGELGSRFSPEECKGHYLKNCYFVEDWSLDDRHDAVLVVRADKPAE